VETRAAIAEVLARRETGNRVRVHAGERRDRDRFGGDGFSRGFPRKESTLCVFGNVRKERIHERAEEGIGARERAKGGKAGGGGGGGEGGEAEAGAGSFLVKIATPRRASRHCRLARNTWGRKVRGKARGWRERGEMERGRGRKDVRQGAYEGARRTEAASRRVLPRRARSDAARLSRRGKRGGGGGGRGCHGGGGKDAHSFLESRGPLLIPRVFPFVARAIRTALDSETSGDAPGMGETYR